MLYLNNTSWHAVRALDRLASKSSARVHLFCPVRSEKLVIWRMAFIKRPWIESFHFSDGTCIHLTKSPHCLVIQQKTQVLQQKYCLHVDIYASDLISRNHWNLLQLCLNWSLDTFQKYILLFSSELPNHKRYHLAGLLVWVPTLPQPFLVLLSYKSDWLQKGEVNRKSPCSSWCECTRYCQKQNIRGVGGVWVRNLLGMVFCCDKAETPCP